MVPCKHAYNNAHGSNGTGTKFSTHPYSCRSLGYLASGSRLPCGHLVTKFSMRQLYAPLRDYMYVLPFSPVQHYQFTDQMRSRIKFMIGESYLKPRQLRMAARTLTRVGYPTAVNEEFEVSDSSLVRNYGNLRPEIAIWIQNVVLFTKFSIPNESGLRTRHTNKIQVY
jgi:hypothetical protein